jgi:phage repressor protein C with HTH and peptisase S24 domain
MKDTELIDAWFAWKTHKNGVEYRGKDLARDTGMSEVYISLLRTGGRGLGKKTIKRLSKAFGVSDRDFLIGPFDIKPSESSSLISFAHPTNHHLSGEEVKIPYFHTQISAGHGRETAERGEKDFLPFKSDWIRRDLGSNPTDLILVDVQGDSMEPCLFSGDTILVDRSKKGLKENGLYVLRSGDDLFVKRIERQVGRILVKSDNPNYSSFNYDESIGEVIGRVVWRAGKVLK